MLVTGYRWLDAESGTAGVVQMPVWSLGPPAGKSDVAELRLDYLASMDGRPEAYLEELISHSGIFRAVVADGAVGGYICHDGSNTLLQMFLRTELLEYGPEVFASLVLGAGLTSALVLTRDRPALSLCVDRAREVSVACYVFEDGPSPPESRMTMPGAAMRLARAQDAAAIRDTCGDFHDFLHYTLEGSIDRGEIQVLWDGGGTVLGTGVIAGGNLPHPYVDIGMCVNPAYRQRGIGTHIIAALRAYCRERGLVPGASCQAANTASRLTLERAGMVSRDRVLEVHW